jgi:hypothetical protein
VYAAESDEGCAIEKLTVTGATKSDFRGAYRDIVAHVIDERSWLSEDCDGHYVLQEATLDWYAQDNAGNIWYFGGSHEVLRRRGGMPGHRRLMAGRQGRRTARRRDAGAAAGRRRLSAGILRGRSGGQRKVLRLNAPVNIAAGTFAGASRPRNGRRSNTARSSTSTTARRAAVSCSSTSSRVARCASS